MTTAQPTPPSPHPGMSCCIVGEGKLTLECARLWLDQGHSILGIVSDNRDVQAFAADCGIACTASSDDQHAFLSRRAFDYLFSIINPRRVPAPLLSLPLRAAINYHDAPLPRYAGLHVTSWAIQNQEREFGVTWHEMTEQFDAGALVKQSLFAIEPDDTAFSLSVRCLQYGRETFAGLIADLAAQRETKTAQDLAQRSVYLGSKRPSNAAFIDWCRPAVEIDALVRGLSFLPDANPLGLAKMLVGGHVYLVTQTTCIAQTNSVTPGTIVRVADARLEIATGNDLLAVHSLMTLDGEPVDLDDLVTSGQLVPGASIEMYSARILDEIHRLDHELGRTEAAWRARLLATEPYALEIPAGDPSLPSAGRVELRSSDLDPAIAAGVAAEFPGVALADFVAAAYACFLRRMADRDALDIGLSSPGESALSDACVQLVAARIPWRIELDTNHSARSGCQALLSDLAKHRQRGGYLRDLIARTPGLASPVFPVAIELVDLLDHHRSVPGDGLVLSIERGSAQLLWTHASGELDRAWVEGWAARFVGFLGNLVRQFEDALSAVPLIGDEERTRLLVEFNQTQRAYRQDLCIHDVIAQRAALVPHATALVHRATQISHGELDGRARSIAARLQALGAGPDTLVGIFIERSVDMVVGLLAILHAGAAYVPLDPGYPRDRIALMIEDAHVPILLTHTRLERDLPPHHAQVLCVDRELNTASSSEAVALNKSSRPDHLAYVIYTSGSTGRPKGVMIEHRNVLNFFAGMDETLGHKGEPGVWLAVTSISFDISVLEIFWSLSRGFKVIIQDDEERTHARQVGSKVDRRLDIGLFYFSSDAGPTSNTQRYRLLLEGAKFADTHGFSSIWTPERHFHTFGGLYPSPAVTSAAVAALTSRVAIRAGSVVLPLHNPVRVAEDWSVVDNLSGGRVGLSFASGWHANDFALAPEDNYANRKDVMFAGIATIRKLWRGECVTLTSGDGQPFEARVFPRPVQDNPPIWITTAGNPETFRQAGEGGFNVLTNLLGQKIEDVADKIAAYREGRKRMGFAGDGNVTVMVHTFVSTDVDRVRAIVREPFCRYLRQSFDLVKMAPWAFPAFRQPSKTAAQDASFDASSFTDEDMDALIAHAFDRYFETSGIFGTPESCLPLIDKLKAIGVDELGCLVDFGVQDDLVLDSLPHLARLLELSNPVVPSTVADYSMAAQLRNHAVTHFQCTPSMARILAADEPALAAMSGLQKLLLGGERLPPDLARTLRSSVRGDLINVYGPTETTVWSSSCTVQDPDDLTIGRPIANTQIYILDRNRQPTPLGVPGELYIGGAGVVRGYHERPELTAERFIANPFAGDSSRIYATGDLACFREDGQIEYLGRLDHQIKLRGYRIELGEIESAIAEHRGIRDCVVVAPEAEEGTQSLVAYVVPATEPGDAASGSAQHWQTIWDETYRGTSATDEPNSSSDDPTFNISGWLNSFTGQRHAVAHMREWVDTTVARILECKPRRVLEIGCGTGLLLHRVAPHCQAYVGVDFSESALALIETQVAARGLKHVQCVQGAADTVDLTEFADFDLVVINSVIQYFPSAAYLLKVLGRLVKHMTSEGRFFIGDVRSLPLMPTFHTALELEKAPSSLSVAQLRERIGERTRDEAELLIDPEFFLSLSEQIDSVADVSIRLERGVHRNEMTAYRYDVLVHLGSGHETISQAALTELASPASLLDLRRMLDQNPDADLVARDLVNARVERDIFMQSTLASASASLTVADLRRARDAHVDSGFDPEAVYALVDPRRIELRPAQSGAPERFDAFFVGGPTERVLRSQRPRQPAGKAQVHEPKRRGAEHALIETLRRDLRQRLPEFMVPDAFVTLSALPLTPNGKIDRKSLPKPEKRRIATPEPYVAPTSDIETTIAQVLQEMLNLERIGTRDNFFSLGANSLLIAQTNNRLSQRLERRVPLVAMYRYPTIGSLAEFLGGKTDSTQVVEKATERAELRRAAQGNRKRRLESRRR